MKKKVLIGLFVITVLFAFFSKQRGNAISLNYSNAEIAGLINQPALDYSIINQERKLGKIKFFNEKEGFGYIIDGPTGVNYLFDKSGCVGGYKPKQNDDVSFELKQGKTSVKAISIKAHK